MIIMTSVELVRCDLRTDLKRISRKRLEGGCNSRVAREGHRETRVATALTRSRTEGTRSSGLVARHVFHQVGCVEKAGVKNHLSGHAGIYKII